MSENYKFNQNRKCEFFPCHETVDEDSFNCLFCYCPLYMLGDGCGGNPSYTGKGIKDCSKCAYPHVGKSFDFVMSKMPVVIEKAMKR
jgi:Zn-finger protein